MTKVHASRPYEPSVRFSRWSVAYNIVFVVNLATTPFMAYMTEPLPGRVTQTSLPEWSSFEEYTVVSETGHIRVRSHFWVTLQN
ncbi:hypothetical protein AC1031_009663 [Aphanomyces cochlioides]|nr:hypothetical protein AC1031_009663 [Aphanomyces cochlioides]